MNFLAHTFLSCDNEELLIGNFIADFISNKKLAELPHEIRKGVELHRKIDTFTDRHPLVRKGTRRLRKKHHKYAPVLIDIFYDYILANNWSKYSDESLEAFTLRVYGILDKWMGIMPENLRKRLPGMIAGNWLSQYGKLEGLDFVLEKMDKRTSFPSNFTGASADLLADYALYEAEFNQFFPELMAYVDMQCRC
jgi:acyl carrier protein phosphodiesterase